MARTRGRRKFYPEFYTDDELAQLENSGEANKSESDAETTAEAIENTDSETYAVSEPESESESTIEEAKTTAATSSEQASSPPPTPPPQTQTRKPSAQTANQISGTTGTPKRNGSNSKTNGSSRTSATQPASSNTGARRTANSTSKKIDLKDIDKAIPNNVREKLYNSQPAIEKTETVLKQLEAMQKDYISQKLNVSKAEMPTEAMMQYSVEANGADIADEISAENAEQVICQPKETAKEVYNDYPFDDEPYKIMDMAEMVMSQGTEPYNDSPYENAEIESETIADEAVETYESVAEAEEITEEFAEETEEIIESSSDDEYIVEEDEYITDEDEQIELDTEIEEIVKGTGEENGLENTINKYVRYINKKYNVPENIIPFDIQSAINYAHRWALDRNPKYLDFDELGGDCTNYISQILLAGGSPMDRTPVFGWYYTDGNNKSPSWTGVEQLHKYLVKDKDFGIFAREIDMQEVEAGDIVQLSFNGKTFQHTPFIVSVMRNTDGTVSYDGIKICAHSFDSENRPLDTYKWKAIRFIRIFGYIPKR